VIEFRDARDWAQYHNPKVLAISLSLEAAELLEILQWKDPQEVEGTKSDPEGRKRVKEERGMCHAFGFGPYEGAWEEYCKNEVLRALAEGKRVPWEVLRECPHLQKKR
jgi:hypothetical protein